MGSLSDAAGRSAPFLIAFLLAVAAPLAAQPFPPAHAPLPDVPAEVADVSVSTPAFAAFVAAARAGTAPYHDRARAIRDGYRRIGSDAPAMGEHWVHPGLLLDGRFEPARPPILAYIVVKGKPVLAGVAYARPLAAGEEPPDFPGLPGVWHDHVGTVEAELAPVHDASHHTPEGPRVAVLHAWIWIENPDGLFATANPALAALRREDPATSRREGP